MKKNSNNKQKIIYRLTVKYTMLIFITLVVISGITLLSVGYYIVNQTINQLENISETIETEFNSNEKIINRDLNDISQMNENVEIKIIKNQNSMYESQGYENVKIPIEVTSTPKSVKIESGHYYYSNVIFIDNNKDSYVIQIIKNMDNDRGFITMLFYILLVLNIVAFLVSVLLGYFMGKKVLEPIAEITSQANDISVNDLSKRIIIDGPDDELKRLAKTFNKMINRIEIGYEKQNRFALNASHELATPLAVVNGYVDIIRRWGKNDVEIFEESMNGIKAEIKNMTKLLDTLLTIAKSDNDISLIQKSEFWLNEVIADILKENKIIHPEYNIICDVNHSLLVNGDSRLIKEMLRAIIDNSVKYSDASSNIKIMSQQLSDYFEIVVSDSGIGIPEIDLPHVFDRFYRVDKARTRDSGGSGLGLSIVKWIVEEHSGKINIESSIGEGTKISVLIPIDIKK